MTPLDRTPWRGVSLAAGALLCVFGVAAVFPGFYAPEDAPDVTFRVVVAVSLALLGCWGIAVSLRTGLFLGDGAVVHRSQLGLTRRVPTADIRAVGLATQPGQCLVVLDLADEHLRLDATARWSLFDGPRRAQVVAQGIARALDRPFVDPLPDLDLGSDCDD